MKATNHRLEQILSKFFLNLWKCTENRTAVLMHIFYNKFIEHVVYRKVKSKKSEWHLFMLEREKGACCA